MIPRSRPFLALAVPALLASLLLSPPLYASARSKNEQGNRLYKEKKYDEALKRYTEAQLEAPDAPQLHYNLGNVLFRKGEPEKARDEYLRALAAADRGLDPRAVYNMGNTFFSQQQYKEAISAYQRALKLNPSDADAKRNLELALLRMQQQQKQQKQQKQGDRKDNQSQKQPQPQPPRSGDEKQPDQGEKKEQGQDQQSATRQEKGSLSKEEAERILNALQEEEKENMKKRMEAAKQDQEEVDKDW